MARLTNWVESLARGKKRVCTLSSWGMGFDGIPVGPPANFHMTFERSGKPPRTEFIEVEMSPDEVDKVLQTMQDFKARRMGRGLLRGTLSGELDVQHKDPEQT
ncbi:MAG TPA: hypothetical protein VF077_10350 [Nitrospiraceae bacterium]